jgi:ABC-type transport system involved in multi-copper enzyme maturation permease subunit
MLAKIAGFELRYQIRSPLFFIGFALFFLFTFGSVASSEIQIGARGNVNINAPYAILQTQSVMGLFALFIITAFVASVVIRDQETGFGPILYTTRLRKRDYLIGRFAGAIAVALLLVTSVPLAMMIGSAMPWLDQEKVGPTISMPCLCSGCRCCSWEVPRSLRSPPRRAR